ncbi:hypothetical protein [Treponema sp.]|uniref:hypothetical protein n=1 Tax=Treponema sp. TaxID=166 RepID=UPI00388EEA99
MKKIIFMIGMLFYCTIFFFAQPFSGSENMIEVFISTGSYIKFNKDKKTIIYVPKNNIIGLSCDDDDFTVSISGKVNWLTDDKGQVTFSINRYNLKTDENGNIIVTKK